MEAINTRIESTTTTVTMEPVKTTGLPITTSTSVFPGVGAGKKNKILKSTFRFSPLRKVAKTAKVNLNRYWGLLSHLYGNSPAETSKTNSSAAQAAAFAEEMEQNRINELLEAETLASRENSLNSQYEEEMLSTSFAPLEITHSRQCCCLSHAHTHSHAHSLYSSSSSIASSVQNEMDIIIMGSVESLEESFQL